MAVRNMLTTRGMPTLDKKGPSRDLGHVRSAETIHEAAIAGSFLFLTRLF